MQFLIDHWGWSFLIGIGTLLLLVAIHDVLQTKHTILHNFPVIGHLRYWMEEIGPELRQYWVANDKEEMPFNRQERAWIYASSKGDNNTFGFGTTEQVYEIGFPIIKHAAFPFPADQATYPGDDPTAIPSTKVMGEAHQRKRPYRPPSVVNISAMSFGSLGERSVSSMNMGAKIAHCFHNSGEGGVSPFHLHGGDVMWQIGTGYYGARDEQGNFNLDMMARTVDEHDKIRCIEIKLSQGAKPGKGGILPASKVTAQIAEIRGIPRGKSCISPNAHREFKTVDQLIDFIERIANRTGLPVGIKSAIGEIQFWEELAERMASRQQGPDFISVDGAEGGTGAAPLTFADHVSLPFKVGFRRVYPIFQQAGIAKDIVWIGSGKLGFPDRAVVAFAMGCDLIQIAREAMLAVGCIQAQKCHTGFCPAGIATQNRWLQAGIRVEDKAERLARFIQSFRKELLDLAHAAGHQHPCEITGQQIEFSAGVNQFKSLDDLMGYSKDPVVVKEMCQLVTH